MTLTAGKRLGSYEILAMIGAGGMGEVYRARDTRLERIVAIKVLPEHVAGDPDFKQRFEREAKAISSLSHPHICTLYDVGREGDVEYLVMELLEGDTVAQRLAKGPLPFPQVLRYGVEIAEALDRAHRQGVTHRDLKPGNIMLTKTGAKLLDFGLAKLKPSPVQLSSVLTKSPDLLTASGTILGTLNYMAPEQLDGKPVDHRADIFSFGAIVYEMATGRAAFEGDSQARLIGSILKDEPRPVSTVQALSPPAFDALIATCLAKDPDDRWQSAGDVGRQLRLLQGGSSQPSHAMSSPSLGPARPRGWASRTPITLAILGAAVGGAAVWTATRPTASEPAPLTRFVITAPAEAPITNTAGYDVAISPDGRHIAYAAATNSGAATVIYVRDLDTLEARRIPGTESNVQIGTPFFSADSRSIAFSLTGSELMRVALDGGPPLKICDIPVPGFAGGAWSAEDEIIFSDGFTIYRVSAGGGGTPEPLTPERASTPAAVLQLQLVGPVLLPGDRAVLFGSIKLGDSSERRIGVLDLQTREQHTVAEGSENAAYSPSGHLIFARGQTLLAQRFDLERLEVVGEAVAIQQDVRRPPNGAADFALAANGTLVYVPPGDEPTAAGSLVWVDRGGRVVERAVEETVDFPFDPRISPDGGRFAVTIGLGVIGGGNDLWVYDVDGRPPIQLAAGSSDNRYPAWSPDEATIAFISNRSGGGYLLHTVPSDGSTDARALEPSVEGAPAGWTAAGEIVVWRPNGAGGGDIVATSIAGDGATRDVAATSAGEGSPMLSTDEHWLAFVSDRTGQAEIWVKRYPDGNPLRVSRNGGTQPVWSRDGRELYYWQGNTMMAVAANGSGPTFAAGAAQQLFTAPSLFTGDSTTRSFDVAPDGRFLMVQLPFNTSSASGSTRIVVVENWIEEVKRRVP
jgi:Tol biopolymer transport system component